MRLNIIFLSLLLSACANFPQGSQTVPTVQNVAALESEEDLQELLATHLRFQNLADKHRNTRKRSTHAYDGEAVLEEVAVSASKVAQASDDSITNNQEQGVDQGDIVKRIGDHIVVLRNGVLYSAFIGTERSPNMRLITKYKVQNNGEEHESWYDELLVYENTLLVTGYSYELGGVELVFFEIDNNGSISFKQRYVIGSNDYFDNENSATRLIGDKLILVTPRSYTAEQLQNRIKNGEHQQLIASVFDSGEILEPREINVASQRNWIKSRNHLDRYFITSNILQCPLSSLATGQLSCEVSTLIGARGQFYVSPNAVYLWSANTKLAINYNDISEEQYLELLASKETGQYYYSNTFPNQQTASLIYRIGFDDMSASAVTVTGAPLNQFSFKESNGIFSGLARGELALQDPQRYSPDSQDNLSDAIFGLRFDVDQFSLSAPDIGADNYTLINTNSGHLSANRFSDSSAFIATTDYSEEAGKTNVTIWNMEQNTLSGFDTNYIVTAFHPLGESMLSMGFAYQEPENHKNNYSLVLESWSLEDEPKSEHILQLENYSPIERRSMGFNSRKLNESYLFGVPVVQYKNRQQLDDHAWGSEKLPLDIAYFNTETNQAFKQVGMLRGSREVSSVDNNCEVSCYDWYGVARPFFINQHIYALVGFELIQGQFVQNQREQEIQTLQRLNLQSGALE